MNTRISLPAACPARGRRAQRLGRLLLLAVALLWGCDGGDGGGGLTVATPPGIGGGDGAAGGGAADSGDSGDSGGGTDAPAGTDGGRAGTDAVADGGGSGGTDGGADAVADGGGSGGADAGADAGWTDGGPTDTASVDGGPTGDATGDATATGDGGVSDVSGGADAQSSDDAGPAPCATDADCATSVPCAVAKCKASTHTCVVVDAPDGTACDDGDACTSATECSAGVCAGGALVSCPAGPPCTATTCDPAEGCGHAPVDGPCDDGDACTIGDHCAAGACAAKPKSCDDGNPCTADSCAAGACVHASSSGPCDDGDLCTDGDACVGGACVPGAPLACPQPSGCAIAWCDPAAGCLVTSGCPEGQLCTGATCAPACAGSCDDKQCGGDGCGGSCGTCGADLFCYGGLCKASCFPSCDGKTCGDDGCGGSCGACAAGSSCKAGTCVAGCAPKCDGKQCGPDGCGGSCGTCDEGIACTAGGHCGGACTSCDPNPSCQNLSFESGNLSGWAYEGALVVPSLGPVQPTDGAYMLQLPTGLGNEEQATASVQLCLDAGAHTVSFDWKFLSEEFIEWCGSPYEDSFSVSVQTSEGEVSLLDESIKTLCPPEECEGCGAGWVGLEKSTLAFDHGDVWETGWMTRTVSFELADPQIVTLSFATADAGDSLFDSVALVDDVRLVQSCVPSCEGKACGGDGCGGSCGACVAGDACVGGACGPASCDVAPVPVIVVQEGEEVIPQTILHLYGDQSYAPAGAVTKWEWSVEQPPGSQSTFAPAATSPNPKFDANVAGTYLFTLSVWDASLVKSCAAAEAQVVVIPDEAIHIELLWNTPNDLDQTDEGPEAGADLDLHFLHPYASGPDLDGDGEPDGWFDQPYDCFWFNSHPNWGYFDPAIIDDPGLDRDDVDGAGPENLNLNIPESGNTYRIGVHYWNDHGFGSSYATLRIYIYAVLVFELADVKLLHHDLWEAATIDWPAGLVKVITGADGDYKITPNYESPFFFGP